MTTQPPATQGHGPDGRLPVQQSIWNYFGEVNDCAGVFNRVLALCPDATMYDGLADTGTDIEYDDPKQTVKIWKTQGNFSNPDGSGTLHVNEFLADLFDRYVTPSAADPNGAHGGLGGPYLVVRDIDGETGELHWSDTPQAAA